MTFLSSHNDFGLYREIRNYVCSRGYVVVVGDGSSSEHSDNGDNIVTGHRVTLLMLCCIVFSSLYLQLLQSCKTLSRLVAIHVLFAFIIFLRKIRTYVKKLCVFLKANEAMDEGQIDFIQTLKRSTISVATAISNYTPTGGIGCIPLNVSVYHIWLSLVPLSTKLNL